LRFLARYATIVPMKTHLNLTFRSLAEHFLMHLVTQGIPHTDPRFQAFVKTGGEVEVKILLNGVEIPNPIEGLESFMVRVEETVDREAGKKALELVSAAGLDKLRQTLEDVDWKIRERLKEAGVQLPEYD